MSCTGSNILTMNRDKPHKIAHNNDLSVIDGDNKDLLKKGSKEPGDNTVLPATSNISKTEISHNAKIKKFLSLINTYGISQAYVIEEPDALRRVSIIQCVINSETIGIRHTESIIDGLNYEEYSPETINDLNLIDQYLKNYDSTKDCVTS